MTTPKSVLTIIGHVSKDVNIIVTDKKTGAGGGVYFGAVAAANLGMHVHAISKCGKEDIQFFEEAFAKVTKHTVLECVESTSCQNHYPDANPDNRKQKMISLSSPFTKAEISKHINTRILHINPLWFGEFEETFIPEVRESVEFLLADAQGFIRHVDKDSGAMTHKDWENKHIYLKHIDLFKIDNKEGLILTGSEDVLEASKRLAEKGATAIIATQSTHVSFFKDGVFLTASFGEWKMEGRTGRGDTVTIAFIAKLMETLPKTSSAKTLLQQDTKILQECLNHAAQITSRKMQYAGPYSGN
eukprot:TRINITY_DN6189_c0_g1_i1.p1 TRINITY_DN6189_c0_g1~~TRINITY_DN6189_c0_g1_i1.p1  ORF type:complete len:312 (-),score=47.16 TRINITY_DN6189_c0_g1_i1:800-1702(-)